MKPGSPVVLPAILAFLLSGTVPLSAEPVDLGDVYDLAIENDPQLNAARANFMAVRELVTQARAGLLPQVNVVGSTSDNRRLVLTPLTETNLDPTSPDFLQQVQVPGSRPTERFNNHGWQASLNQPVFRADRWFQFQQSKDIRAQATAQFSSEQQALIVRSAESYFNILEAQDRLSAARAERNAVQRQLEQVQQRFDVGLVAITDVLESTAAFDSSTVNVIEAEGAQGISFEALLRLTGRNFREVAGLAADFPVEYPEPRNEEAWVETALKQNYSLMASREAVEAARRQLQVAKSGHLPTLDAQVSYSHQVSGGGGFFGSELDTRSMALQMSIPVFASGGTHSRVKEAGYRLEEAQQNLDLTLKTVVEDTRSLYTAINTDVARVGARLRGIESSQSALDATETGYEVGTRNIVDVLLAQQRLFQAQFQYASARYQYIKDTLRLKQVVGTLSPEDIYELNQFLRANNSVEKITPTTR